MISAPIIILSFACFSLMGLLWSARRECREKREDAADWQVIAHDAIRELQAARTQAATLSRMVDDVIELTKKSK